MLGQNISIFFWNYDNYDKQNNKPEGENDKEKGNKIYLRDSDKILNQIEFMRNGQSGLVFQDHFTCLTDDSKEIPYGVTIFAMTNKNSSLEDHAEQILTFGVDCLNELKEVNIKLNANLQLRIGINSGGPILAGVLGTDKTVFDIIGNPINVAARLQTTDLSGKIQISKAA